MSKKIIIVFVVLITVVLSYFTYSYLKQNKEQPLLVGKEGACINSGGVVEEASCCLSSGDFPNTCLIGACGCSPDNSHQIKTCNCGENKCFDTDKCRDFVESPLRQ